MLRMEDGVNSIAGAEFQTVVALKHFALYPLAIDKRSMLAPLVLDEKFAVVGDDQGVIAGNPRVGDGQIFLHFAADGERSVIKVQSALFGSLNKDKAGKDTGTDAGNGADNGLGRHRRACF